MIKLLQSPLKFIQKFHIKVISTLIVHGWWQTCKIICNFLSFTKKNPGRSEKKYALMVVWTFPPTLNGGVYRPISFLKYSKEFGWKMTVITGPKPEPNPERDALARDLLDSIPSSIKIHSITEPKLSPIDSLIPGIDGGFVNIPYMITLGLKKYIKNPPSVIFATGPSFNSFVVAYFLAKAFSAKLVLDYRDEWVEGHRAFVTVGKYDQYWEKRCLRYADSLTFASQGVIDLLKKSYEYLDKKNMTLIRNGWDEDYFNKAIRMTSVQYRRDDKYVVTYVGTLGRFLPVDGFINVLTEVFTQDQDLRQRVFLSFSGNFDEVSCSVLKTFQRRFPDSIDTNGQISKVEAIARYCQSDALLLLMDSVNIRAIPGKTYEYCAANRPILLYGATGQGQIDKVLSELGAGVMVVEDDVAQLQEKLHNLVKEQHLATTTNTKLEVWLKQHSRQYLAKQLFDLFDHTLV